VKIKKIKKIKNFGTFNDFQWQDHCQEFGQYNFFYGWNYSGKTTLSRIYRCLERKSQHRDFPDAEFSLETDNVNVTQREISRDYPIRVFNEDFVEDIFKWNNEDAKIDPVLILGEEAKDLEIKAEGLAKQKEDKKKILGITEEENGRKKRELDSYLSDKATEIRNILGITNYLEFDKNKLENKIRSLKESYRNCILPDDEKEKKLNFYRSKKANELTFETPQLRLSVYISKVENILSQTVTAKQIIEKLKANPKLSEWVRDGLDLHKNEDICQFCGRPLPSNLLERLNNHFSHEFDNLIEQIIKEEEKISGHIEEIKNLDLPHKTQLFEDLQSEYENILKSLNIIRDNYIYTLESLKEELKRKKEKPFDTLEIQRLSDNTEELKNAIKKIELIINKHNKKVDSFETETHQAKEKLISHFTAEFISEKNYFDIREEIKKTNKDIQTLKLEIGELKSKIKNINGQIKAEAIGADKINEYLKQFFNDDKLRAETTEDGKYKIYRDDLIAKNLSTGEKNIISLIYFFAKLEETAFDFSNAVIFIDDPVSSLDSRHIFKVYGFINEKLVNCGQLFITTHNFDFFNLLKDLGKYNLNNKGKFYLVKKVKNQSGEFSCIENLPAVLGKYKSEYNYLFSILKLFNESNDKSNFEFLYLLPNILRRFFEAYLFMKYPDGKKFKDKADKFLRDKNLSDRQKVLKLMDEYSHEENPTHTKKFPDIEEVEDSISFILKTIEEKDKEHYEALNVSLNTDSR